MRKTNDIICRKDKIFHIPLGKISPNLNQPRKHFDLSSLRELAESIRENGILQPLTVRNAGGKYILIAGERRLRAAHIAGLATVPCIIAETDERQTATLALLENIQRADLGFFEEAEAISSLMRICGYTQDSVAKKLGKSQSAISNKLRLLTLGSDVISKISDMGLTERHARALLRLPSRDARLSALRFIGDNKLNVYQTDIYIDALLGKNTPKKTAPGERKYVIKDVRLFYNTVGKALETMRRAGIRTDIIRDEDETCINMNIRIFK